MEISLKLYQKLNRKSVFVTTGLKLNNKFNIFLVNLRMSTQTIEQVLEKYRQKRISDDFMIRRISPEIVVGCYLWTSAQVKEYDIDININNKRVTFTSDVSDEDDAENNTEWVIGLGDMNLGMMDFRKVGNDTYEIEIEDIVDSNHPLNDLLDGSPFVWVEGPNFGGKNVIKFNEELKAPQEILDVFPFLPKNTIKEIPHQPHGVSFVDFEVETI